MATNFPTSIDSLSNPLATDTLASPSHSSQHANVNDAIEAIETKLGVDNSAVTTTIDYRVKTLETGLIPVGSVTSYAGASAPTGWLICDGAAVSRSTYSALFTVVGTTYGAGNGSTTFNIPNLKGRIPVGLDSTQTEFDARGETGGAKTHTLTSNEMPSHTHIQNSHTHTQASHSHSYQANNTTAYNGSGVPIMNGDNAGTTGSATPVINSTTATNQNTGGGAAHNILQPYIVLNYIVKF